MRGSELADRLVLRLPATLVESARFNLSPDRYAREKTCAERTVRNLSLGDLSATPSVHRPACRVLTFAGNKGRSRLRRLLSDGSDPRRPTAQICQMDGSRVIWVIYLLGLSFG